MLKVGDTSIFTSFALYIETKEPVTIGLADTVAVMKSTIEDVLTKQTHEALSEAVIRLVMLYREDQFAIEPPLQLPPSSGNQKNQTYYHARLS